MDRLALRRTALVLAMTMLSGGCELVVDFDRSKIPDGDVVEGGMDGTTDAPMDAGEDAAQDAGEDAPMDAPMDAPTDAPVDAPMDAPTDAPVDAPMDAPVDAPADTGPDAPADAGTDAPSCGNGLVEGTEECDDGDTDGSDGCAADCTVETGWTCDTAEPSSCSEICGDGMTVGSETCDDNNTDACGTCSADCSTEQPASAATGSITTVATSSLADGETFTLEDGFSAAVTFEFDTDSSISGDVAVDISSISTADEVRDAIVSAVNGVGGGLLITASDGGAATVSLVHDRQTELGNVAITETVSDSGFSVSGMSGGSAGDCTSGTGCVGDTDCTSTCGTTTAGVCD